MFAKRLVRVSSLLAIALATVIATALPASAHSGAANAKGTSSLAALLAKDGSGFDRNWNDYDIVDNAVSAVLPRNRRARWPCWPTVRSR